jgi:hypothetical protein
MDMTRDQARRLIEPPREDLLYERAFTRLLGRRPRSKAQRRELLARRNPDGAYPVPLRLDPTMYQKVPVLIVPTTEDITPDGDAGERLMVGGEILPKGTVGRRPR